MAGCFGSSMEPDEGASRVDAVRSLAYESKARPVRHRGVPPFDVSDAFYRRNGLEPDAIVDRLVGQDGRSLRDGTADADSSDVRILELTGGFDHTGDALVYAVNGKVMPPTFREDRAGQTASEPANAFRAFIVSKADGDPLSPAPPNRRQDNVFDKRNGYFSNHPLGLRLLVFVSDTPAAFETEEGRQTLATPGQANGFDLDGTPGDQNPHRTGRTASQWVGSVPLSSVGRMAGLSMGHMTGSQGSPCGSHYARCVLDLGAPSRWHVRQSGDGPAMRLSAKNG